MDKYEKELQKRATEHSWELSFFTGYKGESWKKAKEVELELLKTERGVRLYGIEGWKKYSRNMVYFVSHRYLAGMDSGEPWAVRLPGNINDIGTAFNWLEPAAVTKAIDAKKWVKRQGDVYFIETARKNNLTELPNNHIFSQISRKRAFWHHSHKTVIVPDKVRGIKAVRQKQMASVGRNYAD